MKLSIRAGGKNFEFVDLKDLLAKANEEKSGDLLAGISAKTELDRVASTALLSPVTLQPLLAAPVLPYELDEVTRIVDDNLDNELFENIKSWTLASLREFLLSPIAHVLTQIQLGH